MVMCGSLIERMPLKKMTGTNLGYKSLHFLGKTWGSSLTRSSITYIKGTHLAMSCMQKGANKLETNKKVVYSQSLFQSAMLLKSFAYRRWPVVVVGEGRGVKKPS